MINSSRSRRDFLKEMAVVPVISACDNILAAELFETNGIIYEIEKNN
jgi:hypothetical protein